MQVEKFMAIFDGLKEAYGTYKIEKRQDNGKNTGKAGVVREPRTTALWEGHLSGKGNAIGIIPINSESNCVWGCIDIDQYPLDHKALVAKIRADKLPLVVCRSKSGGAHCFLFAKSWVTAKDMQKTLTMVAAQLGYSGSEIFPKQVRLNLDRGDVGNFLNLPYYDAEDGLRYAIKDDGTSATLDEFIALYEAHVQTEEQIVALQNTKPKEQVAIKDGPPCLQILCKETISEGGRNNGLFNIGVYLRKAHADDWQDKILEYNMKYLNPPLPLAELNTVVKQVEKKDYAYRCADEPICGHCNKDLCQTRKFGIGAAVSNAAIANLRKYNSVPPVWFLDVNGEPLELDTETLHNQSAFQKVCMEQLNFLPKAMNKIGWENRVATLLSEMRENEGAIIEVAQDASTSGQFYDYLEDFCQNLQQAQDKEEILLRRPWTDEEQGFSYFRLRDFEAFLRKQKFFEYKSHKIAQRLRDIQGESVVLKIKGRAVRVWRIPAFNNGSIQLDAPEFGAQEKAPF
jgi:hypothetical protein